MTPDDIRAVFRQYFAQHHTEHPLYEEYSYRIDTEVQYWAYYCFRHPPGSIRRDIRLYQRKFCSWLSRRDRWIENHLEEFI